MSSKRSLRPRLLTALVCRHASSYARVPDSTGSHCDRSTGNTLLDDCAGFTNAQNPRVKTKSVGAAPQRARRAAIAHHAK